MTRPSPSHLPDGHAFCPSNHEEIRLRYNASDLSQQPQSILTCEHGTFPSLEIARGFHARQELTRIMSGEKPVPTPDRPDYVFPDDPSPLPKASPTLGLLSRAVNEYEDILVRRNRALDAFRLADDALKASSRDAVAARDALLDAGATPEQVEELEAFYQ